MLTCIVTPSKLVRACLTCMIRALPLSDHTTEPNPELLEECTALHKLITLASDQSENLSILNKLPDSTKPFTQPALWQGAQAKAKVYSEKKAYVSIMISDGDNIAEDWATLRPMLEERVQAKRTKAWTATPVLTSGQHVVLFWYI